MTATDSLERDLKMKSQKALSEATDPVEVLRLKCLARGSNGIKGLGRSVGSWKEAMLFYMLFVPLECSDKWMMTVAESWTSKSSAKDLPIMAWRYNLT